MRGLSIVEPVIAARDLSMTFGEVRALDGVSFDVKEGQVFGLLGHNGAGKTTLIRVIDGLLTPSAGSVRTFGHHPTQEGEVVRARTGVLTEYPALDAFLSVVENVVVHAQIHGLAPAEATRRAHGLLDRLDLVGHRTKLAHELSAGLKQRVALARALVHDPDLLLLDEPTSSLDPIAAREVRDLVADLARTRGKTVLLSTHNLAEAQVLCDRVGILQQGRLLAVGTLEELGHGFRHGRVRIRVAPSDVEATRQVMARLGTIDPATHDGWVATSLASDAVPAAVRDLANAGVDVHAVMPEQPTLEEVYISLHRSPGPPAPRSTAEVPR